jgi:PTH1 family peptidyl-tRNA hydrolase
VKLVVGLGNPGRRYVGTRHNVGFEVVDLLAGGAGAGVCQSRFQSAVIHLREDSQHVVLLKPQQFMNRSGLSVRQAADFFQIAMEDLLVVCDDINLPMGKLRIRARGSHGGHNGLRDIQLHLGSPDYPRLRIGVGAPPQGQAVGHVLGRFAPAEKPVMAEAITQATQAVSVWIRQGIDVCMNQFNG